MNFPTHVQVSLEDMYYLTQFVESLKTSCDRPTRQWHEDNIRMLSSKLMGQLGLDYVSYEKGMFNAGKVVEEYLPPYIQSTIRKIVLFTEIE